MSWTADVAVKIAQALGVSVEYLATGKETLPTGITMDNEAIKLIQNYNSLNEHDRKIITELMQLLRKHHAKKAS